MSNPEDNTGIGGFTFRADEDLPHISQAPGYIGADDDTEPLPLITDSFTDPRTGEAVHAITAVAPGASAANTSETFDEDDLMPPEAKSRWDRYGRFWTAWGAALSGLALAGVVAFQYGNNQAAEQLSKEDNPYYGVPHSSSPSPEPSESEESESPSPSASATESTEPTPEPTHSTLPSRETSDEDDTVFSDKSQAPKPQPTHTRAQSTPTQTSCGWNEASPGVAIVGSKCGGPLVAYTSAKRDKVAFNLTEGMQVDYSCDPSGLVIVGISNATGYAANATVGNIC